MKSEPPGAQSSHWTIALSDQAYVIALILLTIFHFVASGFVPPAEDELYYWTWAKHLQWSYFDHPPMVAYLIGISTKLFGNSLFGIRFFSCAAAFIVLFAVRKLCDRSQLLGLVMLTPVFFLGSILMTPDTPLLVFWTLYLLWFTHVNKTLGVWRNDPITRVYHKSPVPVVTWCLGGLILGLGCLSKYSMFLAIPCTLVVLATQYRLSGWIRGLLIHLAVAFVVFLPVLIFNWQNHFVSFGFQWGNAMEGTGFQAYHFVEYMGSQVLLIGALPFLMLPWILLSRRELADDARFNVCFYFFVLPLLFFMIQSFRTKLEANWGLVTYLSFWPIAQWLLMRTSFRMMASATVALSFLTPLLFSSFLLVHLIYPVKWWIPQKDRLTRLQSQFTMFSEVSDDLLKLPNQYRVFTGTYQWTAYLRYGGVQAEQVVGSGRRSQYTLHPQDPCLEKRILFVSDTFDTGASKSALQCFKARTTVKEYPLKVRGIEVARFYIFQYTK